MTNGNAFSITIDGVQGQASAEDTILSAARRIGITIPTLCYLEGKTGLESCGVCMVEVEGQSSAIPACASKALPGMVIHTSTPSIEEGRRVALELLLSDHLGDCVAPCERACPAHIDIPEFIREIRRGDPRRSLEVIQESIAFTGVLGRVCPKFCERVCRRGQLDEPISICSLKRYPADKDLNAGSPFLPERKPASGKRVAIVGAGIVGLTAAYYLQLEGHECSIYEARERSGGALDFIIPEFRLPKDILRQEAQRVLDLGAHLGCGKKLGRDFSLEDLRKGNDAVLLAIGATHEKLPTFPGSEHAESGLRLLDWVATGEAPHVHGSAAVLGSGPAALDTCRTLLRLGAESVTLLFEPSIDASLFFKTWIPDALEEGVAILDRARHFQIGSLHEGGFRVHYRREDRDELLEADHVFLAGQVEPDLEFLQNLGLHTTRQGVRADRRNLSTNFEGVFAAGNIAQAGRYAVQGSAAGKQAALAISRYLSPDKNTPPDPIDVRMPHLTETELEILFHDRQKAPRTSASQVEYKQLVRGFDEVLGGFGQEDAVREAERCLQCDCAAKYDCALRELSTAYGASPKAFDGAKPCFERDTSHDSVIYESGKCIKCGRCIAIAEENGEELGLTYIGRGFQVKVGVPFSRGIREGLEKTALECAEACPTGALAPKRRREVKTSR